MTNKERLEEIKEKYMEHEYDFNLIKNDINWLIEQAERVHELEQQNKRYREALEEIMRTETVTTALAEGQVAYTFSGHIARKALEGDDN